MRLISPVQRCTDESLYERGKEMDVLSTLLGSLTSADSLNALAGNTGISGDSILPLVTQALPKLLAALKGNASSEDGAASLLTALSNHVSDKPVALQLKEADAVDGGKIIGHILGANQQQVTQELASNSGLDFSQVTSLLSNLAPALMSGMSSMTSATGDTPGLDLSSLNGLMGGLDLTSLLGGAAGALGGAAGMAAEKTEEAAQGGAGILDTILGIFKK